MVRVVAAPPLPREAREVLNNYEVTYVRPGNYESLREALREGAQILITVGFKVDEELLKHAKALKAVIIRMVGTDDIDLKAAEGRGV
ncbi:MAG: hypothetical protein J7L55_04400, partial [Desulfurococcales archaeon]|nr:hypothetical protein [Desulfurococcales archaeon]